MRAGMDEGEVLGRSQNRDVRVLGPNWTSSYEDLISTDLMPTDYFTASNLDLRIESNAVNAS